VSKSKLERKLDELERVRGVGEGGFDDVVLWSGGVGGGLFGREMLRIYRGGGSESRPFTEEESVAYMRKEYEEDGHRYAAQGPELSFSEYVARFKHLVSPERLGGFKRLLQRLREEEA